MILVETNVLFALSLTVMAGLATGIGSIIALFAKTTNTKFNLTENDTRSIALKRMGFMTALAIGIHNFPEGLATFTSALKDPHLGLAIAV